MTLARIRPLALGAVGLLCLTVAGAAGAQTRRPMTAEDLWAMDRVGAPAVSPDGKLVIFPVTRFDVEKNRGNSDLWLVPVDGSAKPRQLTFDEGSDTSPVWSAAGRRIAFLAKRGEGPAQLHLLPLDGGEAQAVTELPVAPQAPRYSPDGKRLYFVAETFADLDGDWPAVKQRLEAAKEDETQAKAGETRALRYWDHYLTDGTVPHLFTLELSSGEVTDLTPDLDLLWSLDGPDWDLSPDGREAVFVANSTAPPYATLNFDLYALPLGSDGLAAGAPRNLTADNPADDFSPRYSPDGRWLVWSRQLRPELDPDFARLARLERKSGSIGALAPEWDVSPTIAGFAADGRLLVTVEERGRVHLYALALGGGDPKPLARGGRIGAADGARGGRVVFARATTGQPAELYVVETGAAAREKALTAFNAERVAALAPVRVEELNVSGAGGEPVHSLVVYPPGFDRARKWPLLVVLHGGPHGASLDDYHFRWNPMLMASQGYVVVQPNFHGSSGYGQAWAESILGDHASQPFEDVEKTVDHLIALGVADPDRLFAAGGSYGGYLVNWILGHTARYRALVSHAGVYDLMAQFASDSTWGRSRNYGATPWQDPARVLQFSPSMAAANFQTPTLILHGEKDYRVPYTQGLNLHGVLQAKGVPSRIVVFPGENHWILKPQAAFVWWKEFFAWLERWDPAKASGAAEEETEEATTEKTP